MSVFNYKKEKREKMINNKLNILNAVHAIQQKLTTLMEHRLTDAVVVYLV